MKERTFRSPNLQSSALTLQPSMSIPNQDRLWTLVCHDTVADTEHRLLHTLSQADLSINATLFPPNMAT